PGHQTAPRARRAPRAARKREQRIASSALCIGRARSRPDVRTQTSTPRRSRDNAPPMRTIALEEHCLTPELRDLLGPQIHPYYAVHRWPPPLEKRLLDIGDGRIAEMDAQGIDVQVLSMAQPGLEHTPAAKATPVARAFNDRVAEAIAAHPDRFAAFAALPTADPKAAANELS